MSNKLLLWPDFPLCIYTNTLSVILLSLKTEQDFEQLKISPQSPSEALGDLLGQKMPCTKYMFGPTWGNSLLRAPGKVANSEYVCRFHSNQYNGQWMGPQMLHGKRLHCHSSFSLMNEGMSFCPGSADAESLMTFAITPWFQCPSWCAKAIQVMLGAVNPAVPAPPRASPCTTAHSCCKAHCSRALCNIKNKAPARSCR